MVKSAYKMRNNHKPGKKPATSPVEALKDLGSGVVESAAKDVVGGFASEFVRQLLTPSSESRREKVEPVPPKEKKKERTVFVPERTLYLGERREVYYRTQLILKEIREIAKTSKGIGKQLESFAVEELPKEPGIYHLFFFGWILKLLHKARKALEAAESALWLAVWQTRKRKKGLLAGYGFGRGRKSVTACIQKMLGSEMGVARSGA